MTTGAPSYAITTKAGWIAIYLGILVCGLAVIAVPIMTFAGGLPNLSGAGMPWPLANTGTMAALQGVIGVTAIVGGAAILKRKLWARSVLEGLCWATGVEIVLITFGLNRLAGRPDGATVFDPAMPDLGFVVISSGVALSYILGALLAIRALRSPAMYAELEQAAEPR